MEDQVGISKMETVDVEKERERFEHWFSDSGANKKAIERRGDGYLLMQAQSAWDVWLAAKKQAMEEEHKALETHCKECGDTGWIREFEAGECTLNMPCLSCMR